MAGAIRPTKPEREFLKRVLPAITGPALSARDVKLRDSILEKIEIAELGKPSRGAALPVTDALDAFKSVLGNRLVVPPTPGKPWWAQMGNGLKKFGLSKQQCVTIAKTAAVEWQGLIKALSLVNQADVLLAKAQLELPATKGGPAEMDDLE